MNGGRKCGRLDHQGWRFDPFKSVTIRWKRLAESANIRPFSVEIFAWTGARSYPKIEKKRIEILARSLLCWNVRLRFLGHFIGYSTMGLVSSSARSPSRHLCQIALFSYSLEFSNLKSICTEEGYLVVF